MKSATKQPQKRIYSAAATAYELEIRGPRGEVIGTLTIDPNALNAISWRRKNKQNAKKKTLLNLVDWIDPE